MIGDRERDPLDDLRSTWMGEGGELAVQIDALADEFAEEVAIDGEYAARRIRELLSREYDPTIGRRAQPVDVPKDAR